MPLQRTATRLCQCMCVVMEPISELKKRKKLDPGWNLHMPNEVCVDSFQANRAPDLRYRTSPIGDLFTHFKGGFYHDGRFPTLDKVVDHYNTCMSLNLTTGEKSDDLVQYLLSLTFGFGPKGKDKH
jgi:hypothetical protein